MWLATTAHAVAETPRRLPPPSGVVDSATAMVAAEPVKAPAPFDQAPLDPILVAAAPVDVAPVDVAPFDPAPFDPAVTPAAWLGTPPYRVEFVFDKGFGIVSTDKAKTNSIYLGARVQQRYTGFTRDEQSFTDSTGATAPINNRNVFDFERVRVNLQGTILDPKLKYNMSFDGDSDGGATADVLFFFFQYDACDAAKLRIGRWRTIYGREWLLSSRYLRMADRSMATEFFRPTFSDGLWLLGDPRPEWHYELAVTNGFATSTRRPFQLDDDLAFSGTLRWDPLGPFGKGFQDFDVHETPVARLGVSGVFEKTDGRADIGFPLGDETSVLRLTDGTLISEVGALAPGVQLQSLRVFQASVDAAMKYRGWSLGGEYFFRSLQDFTADGALPVTQINQRGYRVEGGMVLVPQRWDVNFQHSLVTGPAGTGFTHTFGVNYYLRGPDGPGTGDRLNKVTFDVTDVTSSPVTTTTADLIAGDDGQLFRMQVQLGF
ncbi:MAG: hypothetical protein AAGG46_00095 [Planctomycetota bacterium]